MHRKYHIMLYLSYVFISSPCFISFSKQWHHTDTSKLQDVMLETPLRCPGSRRTRSSATCRGSSRPSGDALKKSFNVCHAWKPFLDVKILCQSVQIFCSDSFLRISLEFFVMAEDRDDNCFLLGSAGRFGD